VVDEVCRLLKESDLVVIDSSGSSHRVSYEIGFCHGLGRPPESVLLLRDSTDLPFNYRHYRHRVYRDIRHLRRLLRDYLKISEPISDDQTGYVFSFEFAAGSDGYIFAATSHIFDALAARKFSGRCECYGGEFFGIPGRHCGVGILLRSQKKPFIPDFKFWQDIVKHVTESARAGGPNLVFDEQSSELGLKRGIRANLVCCGAAEFTKGVVSQVVGPTDGEQSFFSLYENSLERALRNGPTANAGSGL
jgi:hypothetical protein